MNDAGNEFVARREKVKAQFTRADAMFRSAAERHNMTYCDRAGPSIGRALRRKDNLEGGVFLELNEHWMETNPDDPAVIFAHMARHMPNKTGFPIFTLSHTYFTGALSQITDTMLAELLETACGAVARITIDDVLRDGVRHDNLPEEPKQIGSQPAP